RCQHEQGSDHPHLQQEEDLQRMAVHLQPDDGPVPAERPAARTIPADDHWRSAGGNSRRADEQSAAEWLWPAAECFRPTAEFATTEFTRKPVSTRPEPAALRELILATIH